jgi:predicted transcriptional regulator
MLLSDDENAKLNHLAEVEGLSAATWLRRAILREYDAAERAPLVAQVEGLAKSAGVGRKGKRAKARKGLMERIEALELAMLKRR